MRLTHKRLCSMMAAYLCRSSGMPVAAIAAQAGVSPTTVRRWLREAGLTAQRKD